MKYNKTLRGRTRLTIIRYCNLFQNIAFIVIILLSVIGGSIYFYDEYREYRDQDNSLWDFIWKYFLLSRKTAKKTTAPTPGNITKKIDIIT